MAVIQYLISLPFLARFWESSHSTSQISDSGLSNDGTAERTPEAGLLQEHVPDDLESGQLRSPPQLPHDTDPQAAASRKPDQAVSPMSLATPILDMATSFNQPSGVTEGQPPAIGHTHQHSSTELKEQLRLSFFWIITAIGVILNLFYIRRATEPISQNPILIVASVSAFLSLLFGFALMLDTMRPHGSLPRSFSKHLHCLSIMSLAFTVVALIVCVLPKTYYYMPVVLLPSLSVIGMSFYDVSPQDEIVSGDDPHKADRKRSFQLAINITTFCFMGLLVALIGYHKNSSDRADHIYVKIAIYFMFGAFLTGLVTLLLSRMLTNWKDWKKIAVANAIMLGLLVPAVLMVATTFLGGAVAATPAFPVTVAAATWYVMEYHLRNDDDGYGQQQQEDKLMKLLYTMAMTSMSVSFGTVMAIFAGFLGGEAKGKNLEVCIFSMESCFVSSVSLGLVTFRTPQKASLGEAAKALGYLIFLLLVVAALALVSYVGS